MCRLARESLLRDDPLDWGLHVVRGCIVQVGLNFDHEVLPAGGNGILLSMEELQHPSIDVSCSCEETC